MEHVCKNFSARLCGDHIEVISVHHYFVKDDLRIESKWQYSFFDDGVLKLDIDVVFAEDLPAPARVGLTYQVAQKPEKVAYLGLGPHENYPDRKKSALFSLWNLDFNDFYTPYIYPCENGLRCDTQKLTFNDWTIEGLFDFNLNEFGTAQLTKATHRHLLQAPAGAFISIDAHHMGVGGDDSWTPNVHKEFLLLQKQYHYSVVLKR